MALYPFWKVTPSGNPTILLRAEDVAPTLRASVAADVMDPLHIGGEQVGYVRFTGTPRLDMMGGEFCLNATRAFAAVLAEQGLLEQSGGTHSGAVEVSGADGPVAVRVIERENALPLAEACLHFADLPRPEPCGEEIALVRLPGIAHIIQKDAQKGEHSAMPAEADLSAFCQAQRRSLGLEQEEAVGHLWLRRLDKAKDGEVPENSAPKSPAPLTPDSTVSASGACAALVMVPAVWVRDTATLCPESACGSGTLACALAEHAASGALRFSVLQPSGCALSVRLERQADGWNVWVGGPVRITVSGMTDLRALR